MTAAVAPSRHAIRVWQSGDWKMLAIRLPPEIEERLDALAKKTGHYSPEIPVFSFDQVS
jgi:hypothetical protein